MAPLGGPRARPGRARTTPAPAGYLLMRLAAASFAVILFVVTYLTAPSQMVAVPGAACGRRRPRRGARPRDAAHTQTGRRLTRGVSFAEARVQHFEEVLDLGLPHRRGQASEPRRRKQDAVIDELPVNPLQPRRLVLRQGSAAIVDEAARRRMQSEERAHPGDGA